MKKYRISSIITALLLVLSMVVTPLTAKADEIVTDVVIHKMEVASGTALQSHDGKEIADFPGTGMAGVIFKYWKIADNADIDEISALTDIDEIEAYALANSSILTGGTELAPTDANGVVRINNMPAGRYIFGEVNGGDLNVTEYIGVPFLLELPAMKTDGKAYFSTGVDALHVYPKNATNNPGLDLRKTNEAGDVNLGGAEFQIYKYDDVTGEYVLATDIGTNGVVAVPVTLTDIPAGKYQLVESKAPTGYVLNNTPVKFTVEAGGITFDSNNSELATFTPATNDTNPIISISNKARPGIEKEETAGGTSQVGEIVTWKITVDVPTDIKDYVKFNVTDNIDTRLDFKGTTAADGFVVTSGATTLTAGTHYDVTYVGNKLTVKFDPATLETFAGAKITIAYNTAINETAEMGEEIPNDAELNFDNNNGTDTDKDGEPEIPPVIPTVWTGGAKFLKVDGKNSTIVLEGAEFKIATDAEGTTFIKWNQELLDINDTSLFVDPQLGQDIVMRSGSNGIFEIQGLKGGTYYLVETKAPNHNGTQYNLLTSPKAFVITKTSYEDTNTISVENNSGLQIPQTGGIGTVLFTVVGIALMLLGVAMFRRERQR